MNKLNNITGVILAGGRSSRFGSNKALAVINGKPLIRHVADRMTDLFRECLVVTNTPEAYEFLSLPMTSDRYRDCGPLAGIHAALMEINNPRAFVVACDMPQLSSELIRYMCRINERQYDVIIPWLDKGHEPLFGIYHKNSLPVIESFLERNACQIIRAIKELKVRRVSEEEVLSNAGNLDCFKNINRPEDI